MLTQEQDSNKVELQGFLSMMAGAWQVNRKARVKAHCDNYGVVVGFQKMGRAIGRAGKTVAPKLEYSVILWEVIEHWCRL